MSPGDCRQTLRTDCRPPWVAEWLRGVSRNAFERCREAAEGDRRLIPGVDLIGFAGGDPHNHCGVADDVGGRLWPLGLLGIDGS